MQHYLEFDRMLKERVNVKNLEAYKMHKTYLKPIKALVIVIYYCLIPFLQVPTWCMNTIKKYDHE